MITLAEYNRRWDLIMNAFCTGRFTYYDASAAIAELTALRINHQERSNG